MRYKIVMCQWYSAVKYLLKARDKYARVRSENLDDEMYTMNCNETMSYVLRKLERIFIEEGPPHSQSLIFVYFRLSHWQQICGFYSLFLHQLSVVYRHALA